MYGFFFQKKYPVVLLLRAKHNQNCSFCDKTIKLLRITNPLKGKHFLKWSHLKFTPRTKLCACQKNDILRTYMGTRLGKNAYFLAL